eukprot:CAMPEP_0115568602 /NCGR_PEP_ID=MMETSP0271-20121206/104759_1 /TAXON_ID=71861 /ORGANISM="Scrippsiella trochoidea, Strain CCMP3099" /LENGTH=190 /DNA_ID=CAMNT_0003003095 /DNA_START=74 /DNA_END=646 /DNA_ORIENTATION=+
MPDFFARTLAQAPVMLECRPRRPGASAGGQPLGFLHLRHPPRSKAGTSTETFVIQELGTRLGCLRGTERWRLVHGSFGQLLRGSELRLLPAPRKARLPVETVGIQKLQPGWVHGTHGRSMELDILEPPHRVAFRAMLLPLTPLLHIRALVVHHLDVIQVRCFPITLWPFAGVPDDLLLFSLPFQAAQLAF